VQNFFIIALPLINLLEKNIKLEWDDKFEVAFYELKK